MVLGVFVAACAQTPPRPANACPPVAEMKAEQLFGDWSARFTDPPAGLPKEARLTLQRHAEFSDSLAGTVSRHLLPQQPARLDGHAPTAALAGDLEEGLLLLDESSDRISITGTWNGEMVAGSCGASFKGLWKDTSRSAAPDAPDVPFTLTRLP
jgi:hypothetical protein